MIEKPEAMCEKEVDPREIPIRKNVDYRVDITGMTHEGQGVGRIDGFAVFIDGALLGEQIETRIIKIQKNYAVGKLLQIIKPSIHRREPFCESYKRCGGCALQHMDYAAQLSFKTDWVKDNLTRLGKLSEIVVHDTLGMEHPQHYRNKAQFPVAMQKGEPVVGFYAKRTHEVIDSQTCGIQEVTSDTVRAVVRTFIQKYNVSVYDESTGKGLLRHVMTRTGFKTGEIMVVIVANGTKLRYQEELVAMILAQVPAVKSIILNTNTQKTNVILGDKNKVLYGSETITDYIGSFKFSISPLSFFQVNPTQTEVLYAKALEYAGLTGNETVFDLYCGIGTISLFLSQGAKKVYGVEVVEAAVEDARRNAKMNGVEHVAFYVGEAEKVVAELYEQGVKADVVVVDPPRKGCDEVLLETLVKMAPKRIVYVSCNPATLARDLAYLDGQGYRAVEVQPVDMFPWTGHVECVVRLQKVK